MSTPLNTVELIDQTIHNLRTREWSAGSFGFSPEAPHCILGHLSLAAGVRDSTGWLDYPVRAIKQDNLELRNTTRNTLRRVLRAIARTINPDLPQTSRFADLAAVQQEIVDFNDSKGTSPKDLIDILEKAREIAPRVR